MRRLCIYLTYDRHNIVDQYIGYMLKELKTCSNYLVVVCNEREIVRGMDILEEYADEIFFRNNVGFDAGGFKDVMCSYLGWDRVYQYDELILANDSMFGPFRPMKEIFAEMNKKRADFWGLTKHGECQSASIGYMFEHVQSYFIVVRSRMLHCRQWKEYWEKMPYYSTFRETILRYEVAFTHYFAGLGYCYDTLADTEINDSLNIKNNYTQYATISYELLKKRNFPFLKKQQIAFDLLHLQTQQNLRQAIDYIKNETDYDVNYIWDNIIRNFHMVDLQRALHLQYTIEEDSIRNEKIVSGKIAVIVFAAYEEAAEYVMEYLREIRSLNSIFIYTDNENLVEEYEEQGYSCRIVRLAESVGVLAQFCDYDYVCVLHDADLTSDRESSCVGKSYFYNIWENLLKTGKHVAGILELFEKNPHLGFLASPQPNFAKYFGEYGSGWNGKFQEVERITKELHLSCQISELKVPYRITENFWIRGSALKKLNALKTEDYLYLPYLWSYLVQDAGFYAGIVESPEYSSINEVNLQYYLYQIASQVRREYGSFSSLSEMKERMLKGAAERFCMNYTSVLVYGTGDMAERYLHLLPDVKACVVSDGQFKPNEFMGLPVKYLSETVPSDDCGIVLCLDERNQRQVIPLLKQYGWEHYFCI